MNKAELIEMLKDFPDDMEIVVPGHSDGDDYDDLNYVEAVHIVKYEKRHWSGKYHRSFVASGYVEPTEPFDAICIS